MFCKLAFKNVKKSIRDYTVYFLTLMFGVCIFYLFNSIGSQAAMIKLSESQAASLQSVAELINYFSVFVAVVLGFLAVYANRFLMKRRKKELGIYMVLGMKKWRISNIIVIETLFIGIFSLAAGLVIGVFASQGLSVLTANIFEANLKSFEFIFSKDAFRKTVIYFGIIFIILMFFNAVSISKLKLINLLSAGKKNEKLHTGHLGVSVVIFIASVVCLVTAYRFIIQNGMDNINDYKFSGSIILGSIGTLLFFMSLSGFALRIAQTNKKLYFKNLNMFVLRQINSKINTTFVSMSVICIMLLITIGTLSSGMGVANAMSKDLKNSAPYDISFDYYYQGEDPENYQGEDPKRQITDLAQKMKEDKLDLSKWAKGYAQSSRYDTDISYSDLIPESKWSGSFSYLKDYKIAAISLTDYNNTVKLLGKPAITLKADEFAVTCNVESMKPLYEEFCKNGGKIKLSGKTLTAAAEDIKDISFGNSGGRSNVGMLIVPDALVKNLDLTYEVLNMNYKSGVSEEQFLARLKTVYPDDYSDPRPYDNYSSKKGVQESATGRKAAATYLALYIGLVFLIAAAAVLALQQLSEASDNVERYGLLRKLGAEEKMINHALLAQVGIYFLLPLALAIVHSIVGIYVVNKVIADIGHLDVLGNTLATAAIFLVVYGAYFLATYFGGKSMIKQKQT